MSKIVNVHDLSSGSSDSVNTFMNGDPFYSVAYTYAEKHNRLSDLFNNGVSGFPIEVSKNGRTVCCGDFCALRGKAIPFEGKHEPENGMSIRLRNDVNFDYYCDDEYLWLTLSLRYHVYNLSNKDDSMARYNLEEQTIEIKDVGSFNVWFFEECNI